MKKTLIATAIAAVSFSGAALAQSDGTETAEYSPAELASRMDSMPTVYGNIQLAYYSSSVDNGDSNSALRDNGSTIGFKHSHEIMPGVTGFFKAEFEFDANNKATNDSGSRTDGKNGGLNSFDEAYIGVAGDSFGTVWVGSDDSTYETAIDEISNHYEGLDQYIGGSYTTGEGDLIQYSTPSFSGLKLHAAVQITGSAAQDAAGHSGSYPYQLAATYEMDALELAVAMDSNDGNTGYSSNTPLTGVDKSNENTYGVRASYTTGELRLTGEYQTRKNFWDSYGLMGIYSIGPNVFSASWVRRAPSSEYAAANITGYTNDVDVYTLQALHNLSDNMYVFVEGYLGTGTDYKGPNQDQQTDLVVGGVYYF